MTLDQLSAKLEHLQKNLAEAAEGNKAASRRARLILNEIKKSTTQLKKDLIELDNNQR